MPLPLVSVVISTKNRCERLTAMLAALKCQTYPHIETIVVDDGSDPPLPLMDVTRQVRNESSLGMCGARNRGMSLAQGSHIVVMDDDTCLTDPYTITRAVELARCWPHLGAIGFRQLTPDGKVHFMQPALGNGLCRAAHFFGYGFLVNQEAIQRVGLFYAEYGYYHEEIEFGLRLLDAGFDILYDPSLAVIHYEESANRDYRRIHRLSFRNSMCTVLLRYPFWLVIPGLLRSGLHYVRLTIGWKIFRLSDMAWALQSLLHMTPRLWRDRKAVRFSTLRLARAINRGKVGMKFAAPVSSSGGEPAAIAQ